MPDWPDSETRARSSRRSEAVGGDEALRVDGQRECAPMTRQVGTRYEPVTFTTQVQVAGASTTSVCAPRLD